jgi:SPP1 family phage portal protein
VDTNSELVKSAAMTGDAYLLLFIPAGRNEIRTKVLPSSETVLYQDESLGETQYGMRYWYVSDVEFYGTQPIRHQRTVVEWYDHEMITFYIDDGRGNYRLDTNKGVGGFEQHQFNGIPIVRFANNEEGLAEAEKVLDLIDAYDTITSATVSEIEQLRLAYLALKDAGGQVDAAFIQNLEQTGIFPLGPEGDAKFITKEMAVEGVKIILDEIRKNIYEFAHSIDLSKDYGGDVRVIGWQVALLNLENSCKVTERKFKKGMREQFRMITELWRRWGLCDINPLDLRFVFTRNFPKDLAGEADILLKLLGAVSRRTAYDLMSFIEDPEAEIEAFEAERAETMALTGLFGERDDERDDDEDTERAEEE